MNAILYFLRSTEQKIATSFLPYAKGLDVFGKTLEDFPQLNIYEKHYGFTSRDLGLYAMVEHEVAGAAWIRMLSEGSTSSAYINEDIPVLSLGVKPEFRGQGIATAMLEQLIIEAGALFDNISVAVNADTAKFYERFGFVKVEGSDKKSKIDSSDIFIMKKELEQKAVVRPSDGYDPTRWMD